MIIIVTCWKSNIIILIFITIYDIIIYIRIITKSPLSTFVSVNISKVFLTDVKLQVKCNTTPQQMTGLDFIPVCCKFLF